MSSKIERAFEKRTKFPIKTRLKRTLFRQLQRTINQYKKFTWEKITFFCKNVLLYTINNISMVLEIIIIKLSCILKIMSRSTFPEPQPDSASYPFTLPLDSSTALLLHSALLALISDLLLSNFDILIWLPNAVVSVNWSFNKLVYALCTDVHVRIFWHTYYDTSQDFAREIEEEKLEF